jgi:hypothetical protein
VALVVAIMLFAATVASAQTPEAAPPKSAQSSAALLSPAAFARLVRPTPTTKGATSVVADSRRPSLLSQAKTLIAHQAQTAPTPAPQQRSWAARHKVATGILIGLGVGLGAWLIVLGKNGCFQDDSCSY